VRAAAHANDEALIGRGALIGMAGAPVQVRNRETVAWRSKTAPICNRRCRFAGFAIIEAA